MKDKDTPEIRNYRGHWLNIFSVIIILFAGGFVLVQFQNSNFKNLEKNLKNTLFKKINDDRIENKLFLTKNMEKWSNSILKVKHSQSKLEENMKKMWIAIQVIDNQTHFLYNYTRNISKTVDFKLKNII